MQLNTNQPESRLSKSKTRLSRCGIGLLIGLSFFVGCEGQTRIAAPDRSAANKKLESPAVTGLAPSNSDTPSVPQEYRVTVGRDGAGDWQLLRGGKPYYVRGAGGEGDFKALAAAGANSGRTWGVDETTPARLDEAHENGLTVAVGVWLEHERHGMDYSNYDQVVEQIDLTMKHVRSVKDHPALLVWGIGNEMEGEGSNPAIYSHIEHLAQLVKQEDPHHPVMTVIAEMGGKKIEAIHKLCPSVDIIGINSYGGAKSLPERYRRLGGIKPYIVTEFGPIGTWEVGKTPIDTIDEPTSNKKAESYRANALAFADDKQFCLGSYAFLWGNKQEGTATWFGMLLPDGKRTSAVDEMEKIWTGKAPANLCPVIDKLELIGPALVEMPQAEVSLKLTAHDPENDALNVNWVVTGEADSYITGGDKQKSPPVIKDAVIAGDINGATIEIPEEPGVYRIYAYVDDGPNQGAATANVSVRRKGPPKPLEEPGSVVSLPLIFDQSVTDQNAPYYVPSGFMGATEALKIDQEHSDDAKFGEACTRVEYAKNDGWGGIVWQHPENDWGSAPGGFNLNGASKLTFWAKGNSGGEKVKFGFGVIGRDKPYFDTAKKEVPFTLTENWKQYSISVDGEDLQRIKTGFFFSLAGQGSPVVFYLDKITYEK